MRSSKTVASTTYDRALGGFYWGDNVVWVWEGGEPTSQ
jgi:hypothetical protein